MISKIKMDNICRLLALMNKAVDSRSTPGASIKVLYYVIIQVLVWSTGRSPVASFVNGKAI
jgi:hypothetical protein